MYVSGMALDRTIAVSNRCRHVRIAYLIRNDEYAQKNLDSIFAEAYSRWGGRYTLIVPIQNDSSISDEYWHWLVRFDPDIIYSYCDISKELIEDIDKLICPMKFQKAENITSFDGWLKSVAVIPTIKKDRLNISVPTTIINIDPDLSGNRFLLDNFGSIFKSFHTTWINQEIKEYFEILDVKKNKSLDDLNCVNGEADLLNTLSKDRNVTFLSKLSSENCMVIKDGSHSWNDSINIFIGDSFVERVSFWNIYLSDFGGTNNYKQYSMILPLNYVSNPDFIEAFSNYIKNVCYRLNTTCIKIRSDSISVEKADELIKTLREITGLSNLAQFEKINDENDCAKRKNYPPVVDRAQPDTTQLVNSKEFLLAFDEPDFIKSITDEKNLKEGRVILDINIERHVNYSEVINRPHYWQLPKRYNLSKLFFVNSSDLSTRINSFKKLSCAIKIDNKNDILVRLPNDEEVFYTIINLISRFPQWDIRSNIANEEYFEHGFSDKGLYLFQMFNLFSGVKNLFSYIECEFLRKKFELFATKGNLEPIKAKLKRMLGIRLLDSGKDEDLLEITELFFKLAKDVKVYNESFNFSDLEKDYKSYIENYIANSDQQNLKDEKEIILNESAVKLENSIRSLVALKILNQGYIIKCPHCGYKNWVTINKLTNLIKCQVCGDKTNVPIRKPWLFRLNDDFATGIREHGIIPQIQVLALLCDFAECFYFIPPIGIYKDGSLVTDIDLFCIQDGKLIIGEIKSSSRTIGDIDKLVDIAQRLKPDEIILACLDKKDKKIEEAVNKLSNQLKMNNKKFSPIISCLTQENFLCQDDKYSLILPNTTSRRQKIQIL